MLYFLPCNASKQAVPTSDGEGEDEVLSEGEGEDKTPHTPHPLNPPWSPLGGDLH